MQLFRRVPTERSYARLGTRTPIALCEVLDLSHVVYRALNRLSSGRRFCLHERVGSMSLQAAKEESPEYAFTCPRYVGTLTVRDSDFLAPYALYRS